VGRLATATPWLRAAVAIARGGFDRAAELYAQIGSLPDEAFARLQAAKQPLAAGRRTEGTAHLQRVVAFYREVQASSYLREAEMLLAATA
jgi:thioredoxin-like negative regulator of GroEL